MSKIAGCSNQARLLKDLFLEGLEDISLYIDDRESGLELSK